MIEPESRPTRRPRNVAEGLFYDEATKVGWTVIKRGWPDFFIWRDGEYGAVEVKPSPAKQLTRHQRRIAQILAEHGIAMWRWDPVDGFRRVK